VSNKGQNVEFIYKLCILSHLFSHHLNFKKCYLNRKVKFLDALPDTWNFLDDWKQGHSPHVASGYWVGQRWFEGTNYTLSKFSAKTSCPNNNTV